MTLGLRLVDLNSGASESNQSALKRLYAEYHTGLRKFLRGRCGIVQDIDDIVQEVFAKLAKMDGLANVLPPGDVRNYSYICRVANNLVINIERHKAIRRRYLEGKGAAAKDGGDDVSGPEVMTQSDEELKLIKKALLSMSPDSRQVFFLNRFKQKSYSEVAAHMDMTTKRVEYLMKRALMTLRRAMVSEGMGE